MYIYIYISPSYHIESPFLFLNQLKFINMWVWVSLKIGQFVQQFQWFVIAFRQHTWRAAAASAAFSWDIGELFIMVVMQ